MRFFALTSFAALMVACGSSPVGHYQSGTGGTGGMVGTGGTGGEFVTPANIDQLCRDFCANTGAGEDCGPVNCERFFSCSSSSDIQGCYELCQDDYQRHVEGQNAFGTCRAGWDCFDAPARGCPEEWLARLTCVLDDFECNDFFGDCDSLTDTLNECYAAASQEERTQQVQWCEETCPAYSGECGSQIRECWPGIPLDCSNFQSPPEGCGESCNDDFDCEDFGNQTYCFSGMCAAECTYSEDGACDAGEVCNREGRCYPAQ
jgi:hypothetical protein